MNQPAILDHLSAIYADLSEIKSDLREIKCSVTAMEIAVVTLAAHEASYNASLVARWDRLDAKMGRIEHRLGMA